MPRARWSVQPTLPRAVRFLPLVIAIVLAITVVATVILLHSTTLADVPLAQYLPVFLPGAKVAAAEPATAPAHDFSPTAHNVLLATFPPWHEQVWLTIAGLFTRLGVNHTVFAECDGYKPGDTCLRFGVLKQAERVGLWSGVVHPKSNLFPALDQRDANGRLPDAVILATEKEDMARASDRLLEAWVRRAAHEKFHLVAVYHHPSDEVKHAAKWGRTGALAYLTLSPHVQHHLQHTLTLAAATRGNARAGLESIQVDRFTPWLPAPAQDAGDEMVDDMPNPSRQSVLSRVLINGMVSSQRRDYARVFDELQRWFRYNATLFGYAESSEGYAPIDSSDPNTFKLLVFGEKDSTGARLPDAGPLGSAVEFHLNYAQEEFYAAMASVDCMMLAWNEGFRYLTSQASSSPYTSLELELPLMVTPLMAKSYGFLDSSIAIVRPYAVSEIDAVALFRLFPGLAEGQEHGDGDELLVRQFLDGGDEGAGGVEGVEGVEAGDSNPPSLEQQVLTALHAVYPQDHFSPHTLTETVRMLRDGWRRPPENWVAMKARLEEENLESLRGLLGRE